MLQQIADCVVTGLGRYKEQEQGNRIVVLGLAKAYRESTCHQC
jgi:hypothetical protein